MKRTNPYTPFDNFIFRSPLLPFDTFTRALKDIDASEESFKELFRDKVIQEAIFLASPVLFKELLKFLHHGLPKKKEEEKLKYAMTKYLSRMSTRCTPFGLFAGCSTGRLGEAHSQIEFCDLEDYKRHTRLDMSYLCALAQDISKYEELQSQFRYFGNSSAYRLGDKIRYAEYFYKGTRRIHRVAAVDHSIYIDKVMEEALPGRKTSELAEFLVDDEIDINEASEFIKELIFAQLLVNEMEPTVTGKEFLNQAIQHLDVLTSVSEKSRDTLFALKRINELLLEIDHGKMGNTLHMYEDIFAEITRLNVPIEAKYLFQTDMIKPVETASLGKSIVDQLLQAVEFLNKMSVKSTEGNLSRFRDTFKGRYEDREMPLLQVLDSEAGIGYAQGTYSGDINPIIDDLILPQPGNTNQHIGWSNAQSVLFKKFIEAKATNQSVVELEDEDFEFSKAQWDDMPLTMSVMFSLLEDDENGCEMILKSAGGTSAANLLGRFCFADENIKAHVLDITSKEEELAPEVIFAEIAHLPESRTGNVLLRPALRKYEIPYLAKSGLERDYQIPLSDLMLSVRNQRIILRSRRLNKEIIPRLSSAHNFQHNSMPVYHFLCDMQLQNGRPGVAFNWGIIASDYSYLPRVKYKNVILSLARWNITRQEIKALLEDQDDSSLLMVAGEWRQRLQIPQYALLDDGDNELFVDFENALSIRTLLSIVKKRGAFLLKEFLFTKESAVVKRKDAVFTNEFILSFYKEQLI